MKSPANSVVKLPDKMDKKARSIELWTFTVNHFCPVLLLPYEPNLIKGILHKIYNSHRQLTRIMSLTPRTGPQAQVYNGAIHPACGGAGRRSRNGGNTLRHRISYRAIVARQPQGCHPSSSKGPSQGRCGRCSCHRAARIQSQPDSLASDSRFRCKR